MFDAGEHEVSDHLTSDAAGAGLPGDDLSIAGIDSKDEPNDLAVQQLISSP
jgi:hypothetical protein